MSHHLLTSFQSESGLSGECKQKLKVALMSVKTSVVSYFLNHEGTNPLQMSDFATDIYMWVGKGELR